MAIALEHVFRQALDLDPADQKELVTQLIGSLDRNSAAGAAEARMGRPIGSTDFLIKRILKKNDR